jgi:hypothetical protein
MLTKKMKTAHLSKRRRCRYGPSVVLDVAPTDDGFGCLLGVVCSVLCRDIRRLGPGGYEGRPYEIPFSFQAFL